MTAPRPPDKQPAPDDLKQRYLQASEEQNLGPGVRVKLAALTHAQMVLGSALALEAVAMPKAKAFTAPAPAPAPLFEELAAPATDATAGTSLTRIPANRWNYSLVASVAIAAIGALLALQFDRSDSQDKEVVMGSPSATAPPASVPALPAQQPDLKESNTARQQSTVAAGDQSAKDSAKNPTSEIASELAGSSPIKSPAKPVLKEQAPQATQELARPAPTPPPFQSRAPAPAPAAEFGDPEKSRSTVDAEIRAQSPTPPAAARAPLPSAVMKSRTAADGVAANAAETLRAAAKNGQIAALDAALRQASQEQINAPDGRGKTALMLATLGGHIGIVQRLVSAGADGSLTDIDGKTASQMAQQLGFDAIGNILNKKPVAQ